MEKFILQSRKYILEKTKILYSIIFPLISIVIISLVIFKIINIKNGIIVAILSFGILCITDMIIIFLYNADWKEFKRVFCHFKIVRNI